MMSVDTASLSAPKSVSGQALHPSASAEDSPASVGWKVVTFVQRASWKRSFLFWMRFAAHPVATVRWWRYLSRFAAEHRLPPPHDALLQKPLSKFLMGDISYTRRLGFLAENFAMAADCFSADVLAGIWAGNTIEIGSISGRRDGYYCTLALADLCGGRHEGAFALRLIRTRDNAVLWTVKFIFVAQAQGDGWTVVVGGMQGVRAARQDMVAATRDLSGLRPKEALLVLMQGLMAADASAYFAVSHARHSITRRRARRQKMLLADIDSFWRERCAEPDRVFGFRVPVSTLDGADKRSLVKRGFYTLAENLRKNGTL